MALESIEKGGFDHFMIKEIFEQPKSIKAKNTGNLPVPPKPASEPLRETENSLDEPMEIDDEDSDTQLSGLAK